MFEMNYLSLIVQTPKIDYVGDTIEIEMHLPQQLSKFPCLDGRATSSSLK